MNVVGGKITSATVSAGGNGYTYGRVDLSTINSGATGFASSAFETEDNLNPPRLENWLSLNTEDAVPTLLGFFMIPICANLVSSGKSLVDASKRA